MQNSPRNWNDSREHSRTRSDSPRPLEWRRNLWLLLATIVSVFITSFAPEAGSIRERLIAATQFTATLLGILLAHESGHYIAARIHKVDASLPFFIPLPLISPFGTMGAVIRMRGTIPTRRALLDIGASGPLAGLVLALPLYVWGTIHSTPVAVADDSGGIVLGESVLIRIIHWAFSPPMVDGMQLQLSPTAFGAWAGLFVTMINLIPVGQLDGGHVAYSLFGPKQNRLGLWVHRAMLVFFFVSVAGFVLSDLRAGLGLVRIGKHVHNSLFWLVWFEILGVLGALSIPPEERGKLGDSENANRDLGARPRLLGIAGLAILASIGRTEGGPLLWVFWFVGLAMLIAMEVRWGVLREHTLLDHPPTGPETLGIGRKIIAVITLLFFALLFMPIPISF